MMIKFVRSTLFPLFLFLIVSQVAVSQSSMIKSGLNGVLFDFSTGFNVEYQDFEAFEPYELIHKVGGRSGYSIGGILDVGAVFSVLYGEVEQQRSVETNLAILYGIMLMKQELYSPLSLELSGSYGYSFVDSSYYRDADVQKRGYGYEIKCNLFRDGDAGKGVRLRYGLFGRFRSYSYRIEEISQTTAELREYSSDRSPELSFGLNLGILRKSPPGRIRFISLEPEMNSKLELCVTLRTGIVLERR